MAFESTGRLASLDMPWRVSNEIRRVLALPFIRLGFALRRVRWGYGWRVFGAPIIQRCRGSKIVLGDRLVLRSWPSSNPLAPNHPVVFSTRNADAVIRVGDDCGFSGTAIVATTGVLIGNRVMLGANVTIVDTDFHPIDLTDRQRDPTAGARAEVVIEDDVFVGMNSVILKGVRIGRGSVIGANSVVYKDVPPGMIVAGNPAIVIRSVHG